MKASPRQFIATRANVNHAYAASNIQFVPRLNTFVATNGTTTSSERLNHLREIDDGICKGVGRTKLDNFPQYKMPLRSLI